MNFCDRTFRRDREISGVLMVVTLSPIPSTTPTIRPRVEILGVFGSGKTTLAVRLADGVAEILAERHEQNPFWGNPKVINVTGYLAYDLSFLLQHAHLAAAPAAAEATEFGICDWALASDRLWASMRLGDDLAIYEAVYQTLLERIGPPIGHLYLRQPSSLIMSRLHGRGREPEAKLAEYVEAAVNRLDDLVGTLPGERVLTVDDDPDPGTFRAAIGRWRRPNVHA